MTEREQEKQRDLETRLGQRSLGTYPRRVKLPKQRVIVASLDYLNNKLV